MKDAAGTAPDEMARQIMSATTDAMGSMFLSFIEPFEQYMPLVVEPLWRQALVALVFYGMVGVLALYQRRAEKLSGGMNGVVLAGDLPPVMALVLAGLVSLLLLVGVIYLSVNAAAMILSLAAQILMAM